MTERAARIGHLVRFVLLACPLIGLAAMHSLGHDPLSMRPDSGYTSHTTAVLAPPADHDGCTSDTCDQQKVTPAAGAAWTAQHQFGGALFGEHLGQLMAVGWS
ncbi:hypothetical protein [Micromonospora sp. LH3U1]|uniref:hypothetical protein n=1 Tax=Micromonospora sp. LH3U1 TaxID=3018339 RepID=UPI00234A5662|nr:hypothetical protein [Micromonospora sp. LH3U1]WCN83930.1 hypothetical protein PCA76_13220 [Micromonospora sp. LH3U1]